MSDVPHADGKVHVFSTGAKRSERVARYDLIVQSFLDRLARRCTGELDPKGMATGGALKYGEGNWEKGLPTSDVLNHALQHLHKLAELFRTSLSVAQSSFPENDWAGKMEYVRIQVAYALTVDDDLGGAAWGLMVLAHQLETGFFHDPLFEQARLASQATVPTAGTDSTPLTPTGERTTISPSRRTHMHFDQHIETEHFTGKLSLTTTIDAHSAASDQAEEVRQAISSSIADLNDKLKRIVEGYNARRNRG